MVWVDAGPEPVHPGEGDGCGEESMAGATGLV